MNPSQNQPVNCAAISPDELCARVRSRFMRRATIRPLTVLRTPRSCGLAGRTRSRTNTSTAHIARGISQSKASSCLARPKPLRVSVAPAQLTCTQGRKKQTSAMMAALTLIRLNIRSALFLSKHVPYCSCAQASEKCIIAVDSGMAGHSCVHKRDRCVRKPRPDEFDPWLSLDTLDVLSACGCAA
jgi:hypothetical protein